MRIIGGDARGRTIVAPAGAKTRPTQDYVRESLFNIIRWDVEDARVLDLTESPVFRERFVEEMIFGSPEG